MRPLTRRTFLGCLALTSLWLLGARGTRPRAPLYPSAALFPTTQVFPGR